MSNFTIHRLISGGVITNYFCTSMCRHCLYRSGPHREKAYIDPATAGKIFDRIHDLGCTAVHIGGGEPMLKPKELGRVLETANRKGIGIEYVETNSSWFTDLDSAVATLTDLCEKGLETLLISISPFHNEYIPFSRVKGVMTACRKVGVNIFPWISDFIHDLSKLDPQKPHAIEEFEEICGEDYRLQILKKYWIHLGGRALDFFRPHLPTRSAHRILDENPGNCAAELSDTSHFHIDLFGNYIPGLCAGLAVSMKDLGRPLPAHRYPLITILAGSGIRGLYAFAEDNAGYEPKLPAFLNKCDLCTDIRRYLVCNGFRHTGELYPEAFYRESSSTRFRPPA